MDDLIILISRVGISSLYLWAAWEKLLDWKGTVAYMTSKQFPWIPVMLPAGVLLQIAGGISLLLGLYCRWGVVVLIVFTIPAMIKMHNFWQETGGDTVDGKDILHERCRHYRWTPQPLCGRPWSTLTRCIFVVKFLTFLLCVFFATEAVAINNSRLLLSKLRGGDYAHAGDTAAIEMVVSKAVEISPEIRNRPCLDVGSGFGGTAAYLYHLGFKSICGVDLDKTAVDYATKHYPQIRFVTADARRVGDLFEAEHFSFIYMFNVFYAIEEKERVLRQLRHVAKPDCLLVLFDYTAKNSSSGLIDLAGKPMHPIVIKHLAQACDRTGWKIVEIADLSDDFIVWYKEVLDRLARDEPSLMTQFAKTDIMQVKTLFSTLVTQLETGLIGGSAIYFRPSLLLQ